MPSTLKSAEPLYIYTYSKYAELLIFIWLYYIAKLSQNENSEGLNVNAHLHMLVRIFVVQR